MKIIIPKVITCKLITIDNGKLKTISSFVTDNARNDAITLAKLQSDYRNIWIETVEEFVEAEG